jgi:hypothetical protein
MTNAGNRQELLLCGWDYRGTGGLEENVAFGFKWARDVRESPPVTGVRAVALVTETESPIENLDPTGRGVGFARTRILVNLGSGFVVGTRDLPLDPAHWLTVGMTVAVIVEAANPDNYAVDWAATPPMVERAAASELSLVDPMSAKIRVWDALTSAGYRVLAMDHIAPKVAEQAAAAMKAQLDAEPLAFARQLAGITSHPAPSGYQRALVLIATSSSSLVGNWSDRAAHRESYGRHSAVLSVNVPGRRPYALFLPVFDHERRVYASNNPGLPALVSLVDPSDVRVQWDEIPTPRDQQQEAKQRRRDFKADMAERREQEKGRVGPASPARTTSATPAPSQPPPMTPELRAAITANAQNALITADSATRRGIIDYYNSIGIELEEPT